MAMKLSKNIRYLVRVRDYETVHVEVGAEADHHDLGLGDEEWAALAPQHRATYTDQLEILVITEVEKLARGELLTIAQWSEIEPNLAQDFLSSHPLPRSTNARKKNTASNRLRRGPSNPPPAA
jgi:hypothetical protein